MSNPNPTPRPGNLRPPWRKGESGNPAGSSQARRRQAALNRLIDSGAVNRDLMPRLQADGLAEQAAQAWIALALTGHWPAMSRLIDAIDGPIPRPPRLPRRRRR